MPEGNPVSRMLVKRTTVVVDGSEELRWKIRTLGPTEAAELQVGLAMLQTAADPDAENGNGNGTTYTQPGATVSFVSHMEAVACAVVREASTGKRWYPIRLVRTMEEQDPESDPPRVFVGAINAEDISTIAVASTQHYTAAKVAARPFRDGRDAVAGSGLDGEAVRADAGTGSRDTG